MKVDHPLGLLTLFLLSSLTLLAHSHAATSHVAAGDVPALIRAIQQANQRDAAPHTIHLEAGDYRLTDVHNLTNGPNGLPSIVGHLTIQGAGADVTIIRREMTAAPFRFLQITRSGTLTLKQLTLMDGSPGPHAHAGGAILNAGSLQVHHSTLSHNTALNGGAISNTGRLHLQHSTIHHNTATVRGGGLFNEAGDLESDQSDILHNTASYGGGLSSIAGQVTLKRTTVQHNQADQGGGLDTLPPTSVELHNSRVQLNTAATQGGGILNTAVLTLTGSTLERNRADLSGGGLSNARDATTTIRSSRLRQNLAGRGGGLINRGFVFSFDSNFQDNQAVDHGGGISNHQGVLELHTCLLKTNTADHGGGLYSDGGRLLLSECTVYGNQAHVGGGVSTHGSSLSQIIKSTVQLNTAAAQGGGLVNSATLFMRQSTLQENTAGSDGGGGMNHVGAHFTLLNSTISSNQAGHGGGLSNSGMLALTQSTVARNQSQSGGGVRTSQGRVDLHRSLIAGNTSETLSDADCSMRASQMVSLGHNLVGLNTGCPHSQHSDQIIAATDVFRRALVPLQLNGGPTATHALRPESPALDTGGTHCAPTFTDQRGRPRPQGSACDIGAFEEGLPTSISPLTLLKPVAIAVDLNNNVVLADSFLSSILKLNHETGNYQLLSGPAVGSGMRLSPFIGGLAVESTGTFIVSDSGQGAIIRLTPTTGTRTVLSNGIRGLGNPLEHPTALAIEADGHVLVIDGNSIVRVHPGTGDRQHLSGCTLSDNLTCENELIGQGLPFGRPGGITIEPTGQILITDRQHHAILRVDPGTGDRSILSDHETGLGPLLDTPEGLTLEPNGMIAVTGFRSILRVHPRTGDRTVIADDTHGTGIPLNAPLAIASDSAGSLIVADQKHVIRVDPTTGNRTALTSDQTRGHGPPLPRRAMAVTSDGTVVVAGTANGHHAILRVQPHTGHRSVIADANVGTGVPFVGPTAIAIEASGTLVVVDLNRRESGRILRVDLATGNRSVLSGCTRGLSHSCQGEIIGTGPLFRFPQSIAVEPDESLVIIDRDQAAILRVHPDTGNRTILADATTGSGPVLQAPRAIAVAPNGNLLIIDTIASQAPNIAAPDVILQIDPKTGDRTLISGAHRGTGFLSTFDQLNAIAIESDGSIIAASSQFRVLFRIHPLSGNRVVVSGQAAGQGSTFFPGSLAINANRALFVLDTQFGAVLQTDPDTGNRTLISR